MNKPVILQRFIIVSVLFSFLSACGGGVVTRYKIHHSLLEKSKLLPKKILVLPVDISVFQLSTGGVSEEVKKWSDLANTNVHKVISQFASKSKKFEVIQYKKFQGKEQNRVDEHVALYNLVGRMGLSYFSGAWKHKRVKFDYSLGSGLKFLADKTGADAAMLVVGVDYVSSKGRKAAAVGLLLAGVLLGRGARIPLGYSNLVVGIVDLRTGNLLWIKREKDSVRTLRKTEHVEHMVKRIMSDYPGIKNYNKAIGRK